MNRQMQNPEKWIGKSRQVNLDHEHCDEIVVCENCQRYEWSLRAHALLYPDTQADLDLQKAVGAEEAMVFCPPCLSEVEADADRIDPQWRARHEL